jgi:hypothetical protein
VPEQFLGEVRRQPDTVPVLDLEVEEAPGVLEVLAVVGHPLDQPCLLQEILDVRPLQGAGDGLEEAVRQDAELGAQLAPLLLNISKAIEQGSGQGAAANRLPVHGQAKPAALLGGPLHKDGIFPGIKTPGPLINNHCFLHA